MKKNGLFKIISILLIVLVVLSWIIPASYLNGTEMASIGMYRVGLFDLFDYPFKALQYFITMFMFILVVGGFYGIVAKTDGYNNLLEKFAAKLKGKETLFLIIVAFIFAALSSVFGLGLVLFIFIPFIVSIILLLGYDKMTALLVTFASILIGTIGATYDYFVVGFINTALETTVGTEIVAKIALFVMSFVIFIFFTLKHANETRVIPDEKESKVKKVVKKVNETVKKSVKKVKVEEKKSHKTLFIILGAVLVVLIVLAIIFWSSVMTFVKSMTIGSIVMDLLVIAFIYALVYLIVKIVNLFRDVEVVKKEGKSNSTKLLIIFIILLVVTILGCTFWNKVFNLSLFTTLNTEIIGAKFADSKILQLIFRNISESTFGSYTFFGYLFNGMTEFGSWMINTNETITYEVISFIVFIAGIITAVCCKLSIKDTLKSFVDGIAKVLPIVLLLVLAYTVLIVTAYHPFISTFNGWVTDLFKGYSMFTTSFLTIINSALNIETVYLTQSSLPYIAATFTDASQHASMAIITQAFYGLTMLAAPTSAVLITGLTYLDIPYTDWIKSNWKMLVSLLVLVSAIVVVATLL